MGRDWDAVQTNRRLEKGKLTYEMGGLCKEGCKKCKGG